METLSFAALPFAALQLTQVLMLDGDILIGRWFLTGNEAGYLAALRPDPAGTILRLLWPCHHLDPPDFTAPAGGPQPIRPLFYNCRPVYTDGYTHDRLEPHEP